MIFDRRRSPDIASGGSSTELIDFPELSGGGAVVAIATEDTAPELLSALKALLGDRLSLLQVEDGAKLFDEPASVAEGLSQRLAEIGAVQCILDLRVATSLERILLWEWAFLHVIEGGSYISPVEVSEPDWVASLDALVGRHRPVRELRMLGDALGSRTIRSGYVVLTKKGEHLFKVREARANALLPLRLGSKAPTIITKLPHGEHTSQTIVVQHGTGQTMPDTTFAYSNRTLRRYDTEVSLGDTMLATIDNTVLPSSFRFPWSGSDVNGALVNITKEFATRQSSAHDTVSLPGAFYDLSPSVPGHFGHIMTESVAKLWGWDEARKRDPRVRAICRVPAADHDPVVERTLFTAFGIDEADIEWVDSDVVVDSFVSASLLWQNFATHHFHPAIRETWNRLRRELVVADENAPQKIFVSRTLSSTNRSCRNAAEVEALFERNGFVVVNPETLSVSEQAGLFGNADVVAGFAGSGMFSMLYAEHLTNVLVLSQDSYTARNEFLYATALADQVDYFWSKADIAHGTRFSEEAFHSPWEFDLALHETCLTDLLQQIDRDAQ